MTQRGSSGRLGPSTGCALRCVRSRAHKLAFAALALAVGCAGSSAGTSDSSGGASDMNGTQSTSCTLTEDITVAGRQTTLTFCTEASGLTPDEVTALNMTCAPETVPDAGITLAGTSNVS